MLRRLICIAGMASIVLGSGTAGFAQTTQSNTFAQGCDLMQQKRFSEAIQVFTNVINSHPEDSNSCLRRGQSFFCIGNYKDALADFDHTLNLMPSDYNAYLWRGTAHAKMNQDDAAVRDYEKAMRLNPTLLDNFKASTNAPTSVPVETAELVPNGKHTTQQVNLGTGQNTIDDYTKAANKLLALPQTGMFRQGTSYSGIVDKQGNLLTVPGYYGAEADASMVRMRGKDYYTLKNPKKDLTNLELAINARPEDATLFFLRGRVFEQLGDPRAAQDFVRACDIDKKNPHFLLARAFYYHFQNNPNAAEDDIKAAQFIEPELPLELIFGQDVAHPSK